MVLVVRTTVATPFASVALDAAESEPPVPVFVQFTVMPEVLTGKPLLSANCALTLTVSPDVTVLRAAVTRYFEAGPAETTKDVKTYSPFAL